MKYIVKIEPDAQNDLEEAVIWYEKERQSLGEEFSDEIYSKVNFIRENPKMYQIVFKNIRCAFLDQFPVGIFYLLKNNIIHIIAIIHQSRNPNFLKDRIRNKK